ncbi:hypothetical protein ACQJBY_059776 [Aegilops geniculata]
MQALVWKEGYAKYLLADPTLDVVQNQIQELARPAALSAVDQHPQSNFSHGVTSSTNDFCEAGNRQPDPTPAKSLTSRHSISGSRSDAIPPNCTSRSSVRHAVSVMDGFSEYKRWLVKERLPENARVANDSKAKFEDQFLDHEQGGRYPTCNCY